jgi:adenylosuccinate lyase
VVDKLVVYPERMKLNLDRLGGLIHSQRVLLALARAGLSREEAYTLVQRNAMQVWDAYQTGAAKMPDFQALLTADPDVAKVLKPQEIAEQFDLGYHLKHIDTIFARVFGA